VAAPPEGLEAWLAGLLERRGLPGIALAVTDRDRLLSFQSAGWADLGRRRPIDEGTLFELGSIGKTFTALLVLELAKEGVIDLEAPVATYLPWFEVRSEYDPIAVRHLLTHSAGIIRGSDVTADSRFDVWALRETETGFAPGERYYYSNVGFRVLGCALEEVTGAPYRDLLRTRVLEPLGLSSSEPAITTEIRGRLAIGYDRLTTIDRSVRTIRSSRPSGSRPEPPTDRWPRPQATSPPSSASSSEREPTHSWRCHASIQGTAGAMDMGSRSGRREGVGSSGTAAPCPGSARRCSATSTRVSG
jgi:CubicO group peptidase (beta-lactamase class C family)